MRSLTDLRARIVRGASQVGGSCVELKCDGTRIVIDVGLPLGDTTSYRELMPDVPGLWASGDGSLRAVVLSHNHPDHCGLADLIDPGVALLCGRAGQDIWNAAAFFVPGLTPFAATSHLQHRVPVTIGPFVVTPWLVDHSAYGAHSLVIEAAGRRLLYTGDIRATGRKPRTLDDIAAGIGDVDVVLMEGTRINNPGRAVTETDVERTAADILRSTPGLGLAFFSAINVDRLVSLYRAARAAGRDFVMDLYTACIARATGNASIPQPDWDGVRVYLPNSQRRRIIESGDFALVDAIRPARIHHEEIAVRTAELVITCRASMLRELRACLSGATALWSMWDGYLHPGRDGGLESTLRRYGVPMCRVHASGHASRDTLQRFASALRPGYVVPIHTDQPAAFQHAFDNVRVHSDGEWWSV